MKVLTNVLHDQSHRRWPIPTVQGQVIIIDTSLWWNFLSKRITRSQLDSILEFGFFVCKHIGQPEDDEWPTIYPHPYKPQRSASRANLTNFLYITWLVSIWSIQTGKVFGPLHYSGTIWLWWQSCAAGIMDCRITIRHVSLMDFRRYEIGRKSTHGWTAWYLHPQVNLKWPKYFVKLARQVNQKGKSYAAAQIYNT